MTALQLVRYLRQQGVTLWVEGERLRYRAPKGVLTPVLRADLLAHKQPIMDLLQEPKRIPREGLLPLSSVQEGLWYLDQLDPGNPAYNIARAWHLEGPVRLGILGESLKAILQRHEILRAACISQDGQPGLVIAEELETVLDVSDLRHHPHSSRESHALQLATRQARRSFDLDRPPLLRAHAFRLDTDTYLLLLVIHHFVADGWSLGLFLHELSMLYKARVTGELIALPELPFQYVDLAQWQRQRLSAGLLEEQLAYWIRKLQGAPDRLELPTDHPRPPVWSYLGATHAFVLDPELSGALRSLSRRLGCTLFQSLLAAFHILLFRYTQQDDMVVGTAVSNRNRQEAENVIGSFANDLILRTDLSGVPTFRALLDRVRKVTWEAFAHQDLPFEQLVGALQPERNTGHNLLHQVAFLLHHRRDEQSLRLPDVIVRRVPIEMGTARLDLFFEMVDSGQELTGTIEYSTDLFSATTIESMAKCFQSLLERVAADPQAPISELIQEAESTRLPFLERRARLSPAKRALLKKRLQSASTPRAETQTIPRRDATDAPALSYVQESFWYLDQLEPGNPAYNRSMALRLKGPLDIHALERSVREIVRRHEILRTVYPSERGRPVPVLRPAEPIPLPLVELELPAAKREPRARQLMSERARRPFNLAQGPLMRATLLHLADQDHILLLVKHHMIFDGWSATVLLKELAALYGAFSKGEPSPLQELPIQYTDFSHWKRQRVEDGALETQLAYWLDRLSYSPPALGFAAGRPRPDTQPRRGAQQCLTLPASLGEAVKELSQKLDATPFATMLAAFQVLLHRYTGQTDLVVGSPIAGRTYLETERLIGNFTNVLALRTDLSGNPRFRELLGRVRQVSLESQAHQDLPFEKVLQELSPKRALDRTLVFQVMFDFENVPAEAITARGLSIQDFEFESGEPFYDLTLEIAAKTRETVCRIEYDIDLFDKATIHRLLGHYQVLLEGAAADPDRRLSELPLLTEAERHQLVVEWNLTDTERSTGSCVHEMFEAQVMRTPDAVALMMEGQELTYRELNERANCLAHHLQGLGVGPEVLVGVCLEPSPETVIGLLAILKAGGAYVPFDPTVPKERLGFLIGDTQMLVLLTQQRLAAGLAHPQAHIICLDRLPAEIDRHTVCNPDSEVGSSNLACVLYTSGSTGQPKGVMLEHRALAGFTETARKAYALSPGDRVLQFASISFDTSMEEIFTALVSGAALVLRTDDMLASVASFLVKCSDWKVTVLDLPTAFWHELVLELGSEAVAWPATIRLVIIGGEKALWDRMSTWQEHVDPRVRLVNTYGPSEAMVVATMCDLPATIETGAGSQEIPIGRPIPNVQVYVLDPQLQPVPIGVAGELCIGGAGLARGYLNRPALTAESFVPNPFSDEAGARLYRTGDRVRSHAGGSLEFLGRQDQQVKIRGFRVELGEIEAVLRQHPAIREGAVLPTEVSPSLRPDLQLAAYLQLEPGLETDVDVLRAFLKQRLPVYMLPSAYVFLDSLPLTASLKVDRQALLALDADTPEPSSAFMLPSTPTESLLAEIWQAVLGVDRISVYDNFYDLGGHSLLSMRVIARMEERTGVRINPREMISQSLGQLARVYDQRAQRLESRDQMSLGQRLRRTLRRLP